MAAPIIRSSFQSQSFLLLQQLLGALQRDPFILGLSRLLIAVDFGEIERRVELAGYGRHTPALRGVLCLHSIELVLD